MLWRRVRRCFLAFDVKSRGSGTGFYLFKKGSTGFGIEVAPYYLVTRKQRRTRRHNA
jgi:hypothetical protein